MFLNKDTKKVYKENRITQYSTHNTVFKTSLAERVIRTLKQKIFRYLTFNNTERYIDVLPDLIKSYNLSTHRILNDSPMEVHMKYNKASIQKLFQRMYGDDKRTNTKKKSVIPLGSVVRISTDRREFVFRKGYEVLNSREKFIIDKIDNSEKYPIYYLKDMQGELIKGRFYREELIRTY